MSRSLYWVTLLGAVLGTAPVLAAGESTQERATARVELGRKLFFDPLLSSDRTVSCASCHKPETAFADDVAFSLGVGGAKGERNTPTLLNVGGRTSMFWDGRAETLEDQAIFPIENPVEMNLPVAEAIARLEANDEYKDRFAVAYEGKITPRTIGRALAAFQKTLQSFDTPFDSFNLGDDSAISESAKRGRLLFIGKAKCADCHSGTDFTSERFRNIGLFDGSKLSDRGRGNVTANPADDGQFKVPTLRNVAVTAPYMHNGMFQTLREVIAYYNEPDKIVPGQKGRDASIVPLQLTPGELEDLENFLVALTDRRYTTQATAQR
ncbi:cytochrome-c peroxidase [Steroidobacter cummioxidans]|uniref:cytochrome-c peroxidase n=1 Tax=Steroidobacter cummioxidans TaxID=1803913 RepID=UPI000E31425B|nr:cytochrome c peroxidase [Steroidobacter cummioxidans]